MRPRLPRSNADLAWLFALLPLAMFDGLALWWANAGGACDRGVKTATVAAACLQTTDHARGHSRSHDTLWNGTRNHRARTNDRVVADRHVTQDKYSRTDPDVVPDEHVTH